MVKQSKVSNGKIKFLNHLNGRLDFCEDAKKTILDRSLFKDLSETQNGIIRLPRSTLLIGDKLYNNVWYPAEEIEKSYKTLDNQPFIIDHGDKIHDEIGFMEDTEYDPETKKLTAIPVLNVNTANGNAALNHIRNRLMAGKAPETSVGFWASEQNEQINQLDNEKHVSARDWEFDHNSLVPRGAGSPDIGIGIGLSLDKNLVQNEPWDTSYINDLPDSSFAYIEPGGSKDGEGKTVPRSLRHFPYKDKDGKVDLPHLRNALARASQSPFGDKALPKLKAAAKEAGVGDYADAKKTSGTGYDLKTNIENSFKEKEKETMDEQKPKNEPEKFTMTREEFRAMMKDELAKQQAATLQENKDAEKDKKIAELEKQLATRTTATRDNIVTNQSGSPMDAKQKMIRKQLIGKAIIECTKAGEEVHIRLEDDQMLPPAAVMP